MMHHMEGEWMTMGVSSCTLSRSLHTQKTYAQVDKHQLFYSHESCTILYYKIIFCTQLSIFNYFQLEASNEML